MSTSSPRARITCAVADDARLQHGIAKADRDDELGRTRLRRDGGSRGSSARLSAGSPSATSSPATATTPKTRPTTTPERAGAEPDHGVGHHAAASSKTSTGVPVSAKPKSIAAS